MELLDRIGEILGNITWQQWLAIGGAVFSLIQIVVPIIMA